MPETFELLTEQEKSLVPSFMPRGTMYYFDEPKPNLEDADNPYVALFACPGCGMPGMVTKKQCAGLIRIICESESCSSWSEFRSVEGFPDLVILKPF